MSQNPSTARRNVPGREGLLNTAIDCFARYGYAGTSIDRIARAAGVTKGALYYHFRDKEELRFAAVKERIQAFEASVSAQIDPSDDPQAALRQVARLCAQNARSNSQRQFILTMMVEAIDTNDELSQEFEAMLRRFRSFLKFLIRTGQQTGSFRADRDAQAGADLMVGSILGAEVQFYQDREGFDLDRSLETLVDQQLAWLEPAKGLKAASQHGGS